MKSTISKVSMLIIFLLFSGSQLFAQEEAVSSLESEIQKLNNELAKLFLAKDMDKMFTMYTDDIISLPSYQPMLIGLDAIKKQSKQDMDSPNKMTEFTLKTKQVMESGNLAIEIGVYNLTMELEGMDQPWKDHGKYLTIWERQDDGSLKMKIETWNTDVNPWMEMQKAKEEHGKMEKQEEKGKFGKSEKKEGYGKPEKQESKMESEKK